MSDSNGILYNKDSILEFLLPSDDAASKAEAEKILDGAVTSLKDVVTVHFDAPFNADASALESNVKTWKCPITNDPLGPGARAVYLVPCGHAFSAAAVKQVSSDKCLVCNETYEPMNVIPIIPVTEADIAHLVARTKTLKEQGLRHSLKKAAKEGRKRKADTAASAQLTGGDVPKIPLAATTEHSSSELPKQTKSNITLHNSSTRSLTEKVMLEQEQAKKRKLDSENVRSLFSASKPLGKDADFMTRGYSIPAHARH